MNAPRTWYYGVLREAFGAAPAGSEVAYRLYLNSSSSRLGPVWVIKIRGFAGLRQVAETFAGSGCNLLIRRTGQMPARTTRSAEQRLALWASAHELLKHPKN